MKRTGPLALVLVLSIFGTAALAQYAPQQAGSEPLEPALEARVQAIGKQLRCVVCQGMSIADSPASMARAQLDVVRAQVKQGRSEEQIKAYFVARYGEFALLEPTTRGSNLFLWIGPGLFVLFGLGFILLYSLKHSAKGQPGPAASSAPEAATAEDAEDPYLSAVRAELKK